MASWGSLWPLGAHLGVLLGLGGSSWEPPWEPLGVLLGAPGGLLLPHGVLLGSVGLLLGVCWAALGVLEASWMSFTSYMQRTSWELPVFLNVFFCSKEL